jgi:hypothetical protein
LTPLIGLRKLAGIPGGAPAPRQDAVNIPPARTFRTRLMRPSTDRSVSHGPYASFAAFYPFYLSEHSNRTCRRLHFVGTTLVLIVVVAALVARTPWLLLLAPVAGYGFAWVGHFVFEKNRPATFSYPFYSLAGDFVLFRDMLTGRIPF